MTKAQKYNKNLFKIFEEAEKNNLKYWGTKLGLHGLDGLSPEVHKKAIAFNKKHFN